MFLIVASFVTPSVAEPAGTDESIKAFIERVNKESVSFFVSGSEADARQRCRRLLAWAFDVPAMARYALGTAWNKATSAERRAFLAAFEDEIVAAYLRRMRAYRGATMTFVGAQPTGGDRVRRAADRYQTAPSKPGSGSYGRPARAGASSM